MNRRYVLYGAALLVGVWLLSRWDVRQTDDVGQFVEQAERALAVRKAFRARSDSLRGAAQGAQRRASAALGQANRLGVGIDSLQRQIAALGATEAVPRPTVDSLLRAFAERDSLRLVAIANLQEALSAANQRADSAEARVAQLEAVVAQGIKVVDCRILSIGFLPRCPSRLASAGIGFGAGALAVLLAR